MSVEVSTNEYRFGNAEIVVKRPKLTKEERSKREERIKISLQQFGKERG